jgi:hypothetical protein
MKSRLRGTNCKRCGKFIMTSAPEGYDAPGVGICSNCWTK